jgi:hypothetical protein
MRWRKIEDEKPADWQHILAKFKHGIIDCEWNGKEQTGSTYIWQDFNFFVYEWMPIEEFETAIEKSTN